MITVLLDDITTLSVDPIVNVASETSALRSSV
jgi:hypothetical protein